VNFVDIFETAKGIHGDEHRAFVRSSVLQLVRERGFRFWSLGDPVLESGSRLIIGIVEASRYDFEVLDLVSGSGKFDQIDLFWITDVQSQSEIELYLPGASSLFHTPIIGIWKDGTLVAKAGGLFAAKQAVISL
jgi:hypothetical protein